MKLSRSFTAEKYDICISIAVNGVDIGKISKVLTSPVFMEFSIYMKIW